MKWGDMDSDDLTAPFAEFVKHCKNTRRQNIVVSVMQTLQLWQFGFFSKLYGFLRYKEKEVSTQWTKHICFSADWLC